MPTDLLVFASRRTDRETGEVGYWVDDFDGAEEGMVVTVRLRGSARSRSSDVLARLVRRVTTAKGDRIWVASKADETEQQGKADSRPAEPRFMPPVGAASISQGPDRFASLNDIVLEAQAMQGWTPQMIETEWDGDRCIRAVIQLESNAWADAAAQAKTRAEAERSDYGDEF